IRCREAHPQLPAHYHPSADSQPNRKKQNRCLDIASNQSVHVVPFGWKCACGAMAPPDYKVTIDLVLVIGLHRSSRRRHDLLEDGQRHQVVSCPAPHLRHVLVLLTHSLRVMKFKMPPLSVLDLAPIGTGSGSREALANTGELARLAERLGYTRFWLAEHHGMTRIAGSSPEIVVEHYASLTQRMRVGAGVIMLPDHAPLRIAEAFHTLEAVHPGCIEVGIGRAPACVPVKSSALRP